MRCSSSGGMSPRNSSRSYDAARSSAHDAWVKTFSSRASGSSPIRRPSSCGPSIAFSGCLLLVGDDVVDRLADGREFARVVIGNLESELILEIHDDLDQIERVGAEILLERCLLGDLALLDAELLAQRTLDLLENLLTRVCHLKTSLVCRRG